MSTTDPKTKTDSLHSTDTRGWGDKAADFARENPIKSGLAVSMGAIGATKLIGKAYDKTKEFFAPTSETADTAATAASIGVKGVWDFLRK